MDKQGIGGIYIRYITYPENVYEIYSIYKAGLHRLIYKGEKERKEVTQRRL